MELKADELGWNKNTIVTHIAKAILTCREPAEYMNSVKPENIDLHMYVPINMCTRKDSLTNINLRFS